MRELPRLVSRPLTLAITTAGLVLAGCGSTPSQRGAAAPAKPPGVPTQGGGYYQDDGPAADTPADLARTPDAEPRVETLVARGPNKPYTVLGRDYVPLAADVPLRQRGRASWYGKKFHGRRTASGEVYNMHAMTAAHPTMPIPSYARVRHVASGREVVVRVNDRGPFHADRIIDLSYTAALKLGFISQGSALVEVERITHDEIRTGSWRRDTAGGTMVAATPAPAPAVVPPVSAPTPPVAPAAPAVPLAQATGPGGSADPIAGFAGAPDSPGSAVPPPRPVVDAPPAAAHTVAAQGYWVQLGAFRQREGAETFHRRVSREVDWLAPLLAIFSDSPVFRLQAGPYPSRDEAQSVAQRVREALQLVPSIVERR